jgi:hypothetical protein
VPISKELSKLLGGTWSQVSACEWQCDDRVRRVVRGVRSEFFPDRPIGPPPLLLYVGHSREPKLIAVERAIMLVTEKYKERPCMTAKQETLAEFQMKSRFGRGFTVPVFYYCDGMEMK